MMGTERCDVGNVCTFRVSVLYLSFKKYFMQVGYSCDISELKQRDFAQSCSLNGASFRQTQVHYMINLLDV